MNFSNHFSVSISRVFSFAYRSFTGIMALAFIFNIQLFATDLLITKIYSPNKILQIGEEFYIRFEIKNQNVMPAFEYKLKANIRDTNGNTIFGLDTVGLPIEPYTTQQFTIDHKIKIFNQGKYNLSVIVDFKDEINRSNDTLRYPFSVIGGNTEPDYSLTFNLNKYINPLGMPKYGYGSIIITYPPYPDWKIFNTYLSFDTTAPAKINWAIKNYILPQMNDTNIFNIPITYSSDDSTFTNMGRIYYKSFITDTVIDKPINISEWQYQQIKIDTIDISNGAKITDSITTSQPINTAPKPQTKAPISDTIFRGCNIPNIDLDSSMHFPTINGYAGDKNACGPAAAANSMQWLENNFPKIKSGLNHREKLRELSKLMRRPDNDGVFIREFIEGKLEYINKYKLPIRVKFQVKNLNSDVNSPGKIENDAINKGDGSSPKWEFLKNEMKDEEDVEVFLEYHKLYGGNDYILGRHVVTASGVGEAAGNKYFWYKDDKYQNKAGGTREVQNTWDTIVNNTPVLKSDIYINGDTIWYTSIFSVVSESYDSTVTFKEKGVIQRTWDGLKFFGRLLSGSEVVESSYNGVKYMNIVAHQSPSAPLQWIVRNYPIIKLDSNFVASSFFDLSSLGISTSDKLDSLKAKILYSNDVITSQPNIAIDEMFYYKVIDTQQISNQSSIDPDATAIPLDYTISQFPQYNLTQPPIQDSVFIEFANSSIDLNSSKYNPNTVPNYNGDEGASGISAMATIIDKLEKRNSKIITALSPRDKMIAINKYTHRQDNTGIQRDTTIKALLNMIDQTKIPLKVNFQSFRNTQDNIYSDDKYGHFASNLTNSNAKPDWNWLNGEIKKDRLACVELAWYDQSGRRNATWAVVYSIFKQYGVTKLGIYLDLDPMHEGGLTYSTVTINQSEKYDYIVELSQPTLKCVIESFVTIGYDASIVFTSVGNTNYYNQNLISILNNPAETATDIYLEVGIPHYSFVQLELYDIMGNKIIDIYNQETDKGLLKIKFGQNSNLAKGMYFVVLQGKGFFDTKKLIIK